MHSIMLSQTFGFLSNFISLETFSPTLHFVQVTFAEKNSTNWIRGFSFDGLIFQKTLSKVSLKICFYIFCRLGWSLDFPPHRMSCSWLRPHMPRGLRQIFINLLFSVTYLCQWSSNSKLTNTGTFITKISYCESG